MIDSRGTAWVVFTDILILLAVTGVWYVITQYSGESMDSSMTEQIQDTFEDQIDNASGNEGIIRSRNEVMVWVITLWPVPVMLAIVVHMLKNAQAPEQF